MKLKKLLKVVSKDTPIQVFFEYDMYMYDPLLIKPEEYSTYEDLQVEALQVKKNTGYLDVFITAVGYYYDSEKDKYIVYKSGKVNRELRDEQII